ncbi:MAG: adenylate/guanylate cyclase domain-containing protein [Myxococcaceae bacterium]|nr:MAG: adenylate/guanylate cyclase domain-containing protein [Myxococcaceae bacterium]
MRAATRRELVLPAAALVLVGGHVTAMALAGFTRGAGFVAYAATATGLLGAALCAFELVRRVDPWIERSLRRPVLRAAARVGAGAALVAVIPAAYGLLSGLALPRLQRALELVSVALSVAVLTGLAMFSLGIADAIYLTTAKFRRLSTRLMVLLLVAALGTFLWLSLLGMQAQALLERTIRAGHLEAYVELFGWLSRSAAVVLGGLAGAIGFQLPFVMLMAWRFGRRATQGVAVLRAGFDRVARGDYEHQVPVQGNDEFAVMQRGFNAMLASARERQFLERAFGRYVSPVVLDRLRHARAGSMLAGERRVATVMFSDIRGFTAMSAGLAPEQVIAVLNAYVSLMIETIARYDGYINKFVGDAILVVFNVPLDQPDHALRALLCARAMQRELADANARGLFGEVIEMGIGINTGSLVAGNLGNERQVEFTVLGDTVNVASRACSKAGAGEVYLTAAVRDAAREAAARRGEEAPSVRSLGGVELKGRGEVELFALEGPAPGPPR